MNSPNTARLLSNARCDIPAYACLIGIMAQGTDYYEEIKVKLTRRPSRTTGGAPVITSAGALVRALKRLEAEEVTLIVPYMDELMQTVIEYFKSTGVDVIDYETLECPDNLEVV